MRDANRPGNDTYVRKAGDLARKPDAGGHIYLDETYFASACNNGLAIIAALEVHCLSTFKECSPGFAFREMWRRSALERPVPFEAWTFDEAGGSVFANRGFDWNWSFTESLVFDFFWYVYRREVPPDFPRIRERWAGSDTATLVNEWLEAPFFL